MNTQVKGLPRRSNWRECLSEEEIRSLYEMNDWKGAWGLFFNWAVVLSCLFPLCFSAVPLIDPLLNDTGRLWTEFIDLISTSRFANATMTDLFILNLVLCSLIPRDYLLRKPDATIDEANKIALAASLAPFVGGAIYCGWRPKLD